MKARTSALLPWDVDLNQFANDADLFRAMDESSLMLWAAGPNMANIHSSPALLEYAGLASPQFLQMEWAKLVHPKDRAGTLQIVQRAFVTKEPFHHIYRFRRADGQYGSIYDFAQPRYYPDGRFAGYVGTMYEVPAPAAESHALAESQAARRFSYTAAHEVAHHILDESKTRKALGLPNPNINDIINEWLLAYIKQLGRKVPGGVPE